MEQSDVQYEFEFDESKSLANKAKHGIDFIEAQALWLDEDIARVTTHTSGERRYMFIGVVGDKHWSAICTYRGDSIRLISVRRSSAKEAAAYEGK
jgi:uncharacterized DUF497 family protein